MPKPLPWTEHDFSKVLEAEQQRILDLARAQHDAFEQSVHLSHPGFMNRSLLLFCWACLGLRCCEVCKDLEIRHREGWCAGG